MIPNEDICSVFIGHTWNYRNEYYQLEKLLDDSPGFRWRNIFPGFIDPEKDTGEVVEKALRRQIETCDVVLIISDLYDENVGWIEKEMKIARELDKPIIGIELRSGKETPWEIRKVANEMVVWNGFELTNAIEKCARRAAYDEPAVAKLLELSWGSP